MTKNNATGNMPRKYDIQDVEREFSLERYKFVLQQLHVVNENVYRFLAVYQTLMTALVGAQVVLFINFKRWGISASVCRTGLIALLLIETMIACFVILLIIIGILSWFDYRNEECDLTDQVVKVGFRKRPNKRNLFRWYETYIIVFVALSIGLVWCLSFILLLPHVG